MKLEHTCKILFDCNDGAAPSHKHSTVCFPIDREGCRLCELMPQMVKLLRRWHETSERFSFLDNETMLVLRELKGIE